MNKPKRNSVNKLTGIRIYEAMRFRSKGGLLPTKNVILRKDYGSPMRKEARRGQPLGLNKVGHRGNRG